jgi:hypothetical protein
MMRICTDTEVAANVKCKVLVDYVFPRVLVLLRSCLRNDVGLDNCMSYVAEISFGYILKSLFELL